MVHFDFTVGDGEAETIFDCVHRRIGEMHERIFQDSLSMGTTTNEAEKKRYAAQIGWYRSHINYIEELKEKMIKGSPR
jgi:hypothetical protein